MFFLQRNTGSIDYLKGRTGYSVAQGLELGSEYEIGCTF